MLELYVDASHVKRLVVVPLVERSAAESAEAEPPKIIGAVVCEYFGETLPQSDERRRIDVLSRCGSAALRNAREYDGLFLLPVWRTLGRWRRACFEPGTRRRTWLIIGSVAAGVAALATVPADFTAYCRGTLNPVERRRVFAPLDGTVERIAVKHGDRVVRGQTLVELRNTDLDIAEADVEGRRTASAEQLAAVERALFDEAKRLTAEERARLSGERSQLREQLASLDRQLELYADKRRQLMVVSPIDGEVTTWSADDLLENRPVRQGQQLLTIAAVGGPWELELRVPDDRSGRVVEAARTSSEPLRVTYSPAVSPGIRHEGWIVEIQNSAELRGEDGNTVQVRATVDAAQLPQRRPGAEAAAHIHCGRRAVGYVWLCDVYGFLRSRVLFRWF
jgi:multidrug efflux pump subunit AcrA (membrane-fusion protein)